MATKKKLDDIKSLTINKKVNWDYQLRWHLNNICNFHCWYCIQGNKNSDTYTQEDIDNYNNQALKIVDKLNKEMSDIHNKRILINVLGGEPTLIDLPMIFDAIDPKDNFLRIKTTTNFSCSQEYLDRLYKVFEDSNNKELKISISLHPEMSIEELIEKLNGNTSYINAITVVVDGYETYYDYCELKDKIDDRVVSHLCIDRNTNTIITPQDIIDKLNLKSSGGKWTIYYKDDTEEQCGRYDLLTAFGEDNKIPSFYGMNCLGRTKIMIDGKSRTCKYDTPSADAPYLNKEFRVCPYKNSCNLCDVEKIENDFKQE